jgi:hypothetical protein
MRTRPRLPENLRLTNAIKKAHEAPNIVPRYSKSKRAIAPFAPSKRPVTLPKLRCLEDES